MVRELTGKPERKFVWAELSFFMRWFSSQTRDMRDAFAALVSNGQVEFVGGGWVQNDEANPAPEEVIDQVWWRIGTCGAVTAVLLNRLWMCR